MAPPNHEIRRASTRYCIIVALTEVAGGEGGREGYILGWGEFLKQIEPGSAPTSKV
jgi:hypothetical protein